MEDHFAFLKLETRNNRDILVVDGLDPKEASFYTKARTLLAFYNMNHMLQYDSNSGVLAPKGQTCEYPGINLNSEHVGVIPYRLTPDGLHQPGFAILSQNALPVFDRFLHRPMFWLLAPEQQRLLQRFKDTLNPE